VTISAWHSRAAMVLLTLLASGCASHQFGPRTVGPAQRDYNEALGRAIDQQLLLNLVRLRYRENPLFLEFSSIVAQFNRSASIGASAKFLRGGADESGFSIGGSGSETPVLTLIPVKGRDFVQRMLAPIQPESFVALVQSGWSIERLLVCCVQEIARTRNVDPGSGRMLDLAPELDRFREIARVLRAIQVAGGIDFAVEDQRALHLDFDRLAGNALVGERAAIRRVLGVPESVTRFRLTFPRADSRAGDVGLVGRSFYGTLQLLAQGVEVPSDAESGDVEWNRALGGVFAMHSGPARPDAAVLAVFHRGHWFWIADDDRESRTTFLLLSLLTSLKSGESAAQAPLLTIGREE
jgi:hypothetical protein